MLPLLLLHGFTLEDEIPKNVCANAAVPCNAAEERPDFDLRENCLHPGAIFTFFEHIKAFAEGQVTPSVMG